MIIEEDQLKYGILAPNRDNYSAINNFSIVTKIEYGNDSIIIMADAESDSENDILNNDYNLKANILRVGHHGGKTSSMKKFLDAVTPDYSVISVGKDNPYGHPHKETLKRLEETDTQIMRIDKLGDIIVISNGRGLTWDKNNVAKSGIGIQYIGNKNTRVFHKDDCNSLPNKENQRIFKSREEAIYNKYRPHKVCLE